MNTEQKQAALIDMSQVYSAFRSGAPEIAVSKLREQSEAERSAGNVKGAEYGEMLATMAEKSQEAAEKGKPLGLPRGFHGGRDRD